MKIILSRKGTDSAAGGIPGVILPNNKIVHIPIPGDDYESITYGDILFEKDRSIGNLITGLTNNISNGKTKILFNNSIKCHFDPDINYHAYPREEDWCGCFGQMGAAQSVLINANVEIGDIFLFFGWFNNTMLINNELKYCKGQGFHMIYGWLQIEKIIYTNNTKVPSWLLYHPHLNENKVNELSNCIYVGSENLSFNPNIKGYGVFEEFDESLLLTKNGMTRSKWDLPHLFKDVTITYHNENSWKEDYFQSAFRGQEFVCNENEKISKWVDDLFTTNIK